MQLDLFRGTHIPATAAREALARGDLAAAGEALASSVSAEERGEGARCVALAARLARSAEVEDVHDAFAESLDGTTWRVIDVTRLAELYAGQLMGMLGVAERFRGWTPGHFAWAAGDGRAALAWAEAATVGPPGQDWIEAARLAFACDRPARARELLAGACLGSGVELAAEPPALRSCGVPALDGLRRLPELPARVLELWLRVADLELPKPCSPWVAVLGELDRLWVVPRWAVPEESGPPGGDDDPAPPPADPARSFLLALRAARRARERDRPRGGPAGQCSDRELRARRRMRQLSPVLLDRYLATLEGNLFG